MRGSSSPTAHRPDRPSGEPPPREEHLPRKGLTGALRSSSEQGREEQEESDNLGIRLTAEQGCAAERLGLQGKSLSASHGWVLPPGK